MSQDDKDTEVMLKVLENQVAEVKDTMTDNIVKMQERGGNLDDLESRATVLSEETVSLLIKVSRRKSKQDTFSFDKKSSISEVMGGSKSLILI